jgi:hypothetical protein
VKGDPMTPITLPPQSYLDQLFKYDPETGVLLWRTRPPEHFSRPMDWKTWNSRFAGTRAGRVAQGRRAVSIDGKRFLTSRIIWKMATNDEPPEVDHRDLDKLNERFGNLRAATRSQNGANRTRKRADGLPKGVTRDGNRYIATIAMNRVVHNLGRFDSPEQASAAYREAARLLHREFARVD